MIVAVFLLSIAFLISSVYGIHQYTVNKEYIKVLNELKNPLRKGIYEVNLVQGEKEKFTSDVHVIEIERYKNGKSKVEIINIDYNTDDGVVSHKKIDKYIHDKIVIDCG